MGKKTEHIQIKEEDQDEEYLIGGPKPKKYGGENRNQITEEPKWDPKLVAFFSIGVLSFIYVIGELSIAIWLDSLVLLSDGFHNLSDVVSLYIAYWAQQAAKRDQSHDMSYGWVRTEILGGLTNGCFLLSLCLYVVLECIPKFLRPVDIQGGLLFMITAGIGLAVNTIGTIVFSLTGQAHGHSHSHGHGHGHKEEKKEEKGHDHGHSHGHKEKKPNLEELDITEVDIKKKEKKDKEKKEKKEKGHEHGHEHGHKHKEGKKKKEKKEKKDMNVHAVFLHFLGDAISSVFVLIAGALIHFFDGAWVLYIDPLSSLLIVGIILFTTVPLVKRCSMILLQSTPNDLDVENMKQRMLKVEGTLSIHDFHIWQLVDGMIIASVHVGVEEGCDFGNIIIEIKRVLHDYGIHSTTIQPEFVPRNIRAVTDFCEQNCVQECDEDWCCKKPAEKKKKMADEFSTTTAL